MRRWPIDVGRASWWRRRWARTTPLSSSQVSRAPPRRLSRGVPVAPSRIVAAALTSISALLSIPAYPFWSLCVFALAIVIIYQLAKAPENYGVSYVD
jgi:hypothetical protein